MTATAAVSNPKRARAAKPFTLPHFRAWAAKLTLDNGKPWKLEPFQARFVNDLFKGFPVCWLIVPEGNGKTTLLAGLALYHIEHKLSGYVAVAASARDQAEWIYRQAAGFVARAERENEFRCLEGYRRIRYDAMDSRIQVFSADDRSGDGAIASFYILDELHRHKDLALYLTWMGKLGKTGAQLVAISTAGEVGSAFEEERTRARQSGQVTREGAFVRAEKRDSVLHEWALAEDANPEDLAAVKAANPFRGITVESLQRKRDLPGMTPAHWSRFSCNRASRSEFAAITETEWQGAVTATPFPSGEEIWLGLDVGWRDDTTGIVPLWWRDSEFRFLGPATILVPPRKTGHMLDPYALQAALSKIHDQNPIHTVVMDMHHAAAESAWIESELGCRIIDRGQGNPFHADDYQRFMEALRRGWLKHTGDPGLTQHVLNAIARTLPRGDTRFDRPQEGRRSSQQDRRVIDALTAAAMVHSARAIEDEQPPKRHRTFSF